MEIKVKYLEGQKFQVESGQHRLLIDQPKEKGGSDQGMSPLEVFLSALGSCAGAYAKMYCQNAGIDTQNLEVSVTAALTSDRPLRFQEIKIKISLGVDLGDRKSALLSFVKNCPVHNTLKANSSVEFTI